MSYETVFKPRGGKLYNPFSELEKEGRRLIFGSEDYNTSSKKVLKEVGNNKILSARIQRNPVPRYIIELLNIVSLGDFKKKLKETEYDKLFHLAIVFETDKGEVLVEKNEVINISKSIPTNKEGLEVKRVNINNSPTINTVLENTKRLQGDKYFKYSASDNNCQNFILSLLKSNNIGTEEDYQFVKQNTEELFKSNPFLKKIADTVTDTAATFTGRGKKLKGGLLVKENPYGDW
jgi:hypothetical protein